MFSFAARCQGLCGSQKYTWTVRGDREGLVLGHLHSAIPRQRASQREAYERADSKQPRQLPCPCSSPDSNCIESHF